MCNSEFLRPNDLLEHIVSSHISQILRTIIGEFLTCCLPHLTKVTFFFLFFFLQGSKSSGQSKVTRITSDHNFSLLVRPECIQVFQELREVISYMRPCCSLERFSIEYQLGLGLVVLLSKTFDVSL